MLLHHEINNTLYKIFFIVQLNYLQFHHVWNASDKDYSFLGFLSAQQHQVKYDQEKIGIAIKFCKYYVINKTQLKIKNLI